MIRIEVKTKDQAAIMNYALGIAHQALANNLEQVADDKLDTHYESIKWTRKHAQSLNDKFELEVS
tara:strand:- start:441 stop:635 length:195 start_codon:yes stop_codon:yes gene_type:complete